MPGGAAANQAGRRAISAAWVIDGDTHCPVFLPRRRPVPASSWSSPSDTAKIACDLRLPSRRTFIFASLTPSIPSQVCARQTGLTPPHGLTRSRL
uniref:Uncharacterized protein n=1 Tax=Oryza rufipogon TaxID=4529 RepID=A0A0E0PTR9_ORYRU